MKCRQVNAFARIGSRFWPAERVLQTCQKRCSGIGRRHSLLFSRKASLSPVIVYRILMTFVSLVLLLRDCLRGDWALAAGRLGRGAAAPGPHLWLHAASNGELTSARPLIEHVLSLRPDLGILITCNTASAVELAKSWQLDRVSARLAPFDLGFINRRMLKKWQVVAHVTMESELWPDRVMRCSAAGIPVAIFGARLTQRTARGWARVGRLSRRILGRISYLSAQDSRSLARMRALGLRASAAGPVLDLKASYTPPPDLTPDTALHAAFPRAQTWLAASTHPGDEQVVIKAHLLARASRPDLRLILAPRHARRGDGVAAQLEAAGLAFSRRSLGEPPAKEVLLADTMGEMALWYAQAGIVFIGGTLSDRGGHTPYEPAAFGGAIVHGPDVHNFSAAFSRLQRAGAALCIKTPQDLAQALVELENPAAQARLGVAAQEALHQADALERVKADLGRLLAA